jgi:zinc-binding alcohol dehydrogenase/oxidoreductase
MNMLAAIVDGAVAGHVRAGEWPDPQPGRGEALVRLRCAAINHHDLRTAAVADGWPAPAVIGSDGAGVVEAVGDGVDAGLIGREVVIYPALRWGDDERAQGEDFEILGYPTQGTQAEAIVVPADSLYPKPARLDWEQAAALPLAGLSAWRALVTRGELRAGDRVLVTGASGGVASFAVQLVAALGAEAVVTSSTSDRVERACTLGAIGGVVRDAGWPQELMQRFGRFDLVLDSSGADWDALLGSLAPSGRLVAIGRTVDPRPAVDVGLLFNGQHDIRGSMMGSPTEFAALLAHVDNASWRPVVDSVVPLHDAAAGYERVAAGNHFGKVVLQLEN